MFSLISPLISVRWKSLKFVAICGFERWPFSLRKSYHPPKKYWLTEECFLNCHILEFRPSVKSPLTDTRSTPWLLWVFLFRAFVFVFLCAFFPCLARVGLAAFSLVPDPQQYTSSLLYSTPISVRQRLFPKQLHQISKNRFFITHIHTRAYLSNVLLPTSARRHPHCTGIQIPVKKVYKYKDPTLARWKWLQFVICPLRFNYSLL